MKIYRVEDDQGTGMYRTSIALREMNCSDKRHPSPWDDMKLSEPWENMDLYERSKMFFGFSSLDQLKFWIYLEEWRKLLKKEGYFISVYECEPDDAIIGETQAIFIRSSATKIQQLDFLEI